MRHQIYGKKLNRTSSHRQAMLKNLAAALFEHGEVRTTMAKAKAVQPLVEKIITIARKGTFESRRQVEQRINDRMIHMWVADPAVREEKKRNPYFDLPAAEDIEFNRYGEVRKAPRLVQHIMTVVAPRFRERAGGYTRVVKLGTNRLGDAADLVLLQLVGEEEGPEVGGGTPARRDQKARRRAFAKKVMAGGAGASEAAPEADVEADSPAEEDTSADS